MLDTITSFFKIDSVDVSNDLKNSNSNFLVNEKNDLIDWITIVFLPLLSFIMMILASLFVVIEKKKSESFGLK